MDEADAQRWLAEHCNVSRGTLDRLQEFVNLLREENQRQNLISAGTLDQIWSRHIVDSAQLLKFTNSEAESWLDLGTGAGFPGLVIALLRGGRTVMVEERRRRVDFLREGAAVLGIGDRCEIVATKAERLETRPFDVISARAFAPLDRLLTLGLRFATPATRWILPKGRNARLELEAAESSWQGAFRVEPSITDAEAGIIVAEQVRLRMKGKRGQ